MSQIVLQFAEMKNQAMNADVVSLQKEITQGMKQSRGMLK
jgi:hypothetical protein